MPNGPEFSNLSQSIEQADKRIQQKVDNVNEKRLGEHVKKLEQKIAQSPSAKLKEKYTQQLQALKAKFETLKTGESKELVKNLQSNVRATLTSLNQFAKQNGLENFTINVDRAMADSAGQLKLEKWYPRTNQYNDISRIFKYHLGIRPHPSNPVFREACILLVNQKLEQNGEPLLDTSKREDYKKALKFIRHNFDPGDKFDLVRLRQELTPKKSKPHRRVMTFPKGFDLSKRRPAKGPKLAQAPKIRPTQQEVKEFNKHRNDTKQKMELFYRHLTSMISAKTKSLRLNYAKQMSITLKELTDTSKSIEDQRLKLAAKSPNHPLIKPLTQLQIRLEMMFAKLELNRQFNKAKSRSDAARKNTKSYISALNLLNLGPKLYRFASGDKNTLTYDEAKLKVYQNVTDRQRQNLNGSTIAEYLLQKFNNNWDQVRRLGSKAFAQLITKDPKFAILIIQTKFKIDKRHNENDQQARLRTAYMALKSFTYSPAGRRISLINRGPKGSPDKYKEHLQKIAYREAQNIENLYGPRGASFAYPLYVKAIKMAPNSALAKKIQERIKSWAQWWERTYASVSDVCHELSNASAVLAPGVGSLAGMGLAKIPHAVKLATAIKAGWTALEGAGKIGKALAGLRVLAFSNPANAKILQTAAEAGRIKAFSLGLARFTSTLGTALLRTSALAAGAETIYKGSGRAVVAAAFGVPSLMRSFTNTLSKAVSKSVAKQMLAEAAANPQGHSRLMNAYFLHIQRTYSREAFEKVVAPKLIAQLESQGVQNAKQAVEKFTNQLFADKAKNTILQAAKNNPIAKSILKSEVNTAEQEFSKLFKFVENLPAGQKLNETAFVNSVKNFFNKIRSISHYEMNQHTFNQIVEEFNQLVFQVESKIALQHRSIAVAPLQKTLKYLQSFAGKGIKTDALNQTAKYLEGVAASSRRINSLPILTKELHQGKAPIKRSAPIDIKTRSGQPPSVSRQAKVQHPDAFAKTSALDVSDIVPPLNGARLISAAQKELNQLAKYLRNDIKLNPTGTSKLFQQELETALNQVQSITTWTPENIALAVNTLSNLAQRIETQLPLAFRGYAIAPLQKLTRSLQALKNLPNPLKSRLEETSKLLSILKERSTGLTNRYSPSARLPEVTRKAPLKKAQINPEKRRFFSILSELHSFQRNFNRHSSISPELQEKARAFIKNLEQRIKNADLTPYSKKELELQIKAFKEKLTKLKGDTSPTPTPSPTPKPAPAPPSTPKAPTLNPINAANLTPQEQAILNEINTQITKFQNTFTNRNLTPQLLQRADAMLNRIEQQLNNSALNQATKKQVRDQLEAIKAKIAKPQAAPTPNIPPKVPTSQPPQTPPAAPSQTPPQLTQEIQGEANKLLKVISNNSKSLATNETKKHTTSIKKFIESFGKVQNWTQDKLTQAAQSLLKIASELKLPFSLREAASASLRKIHTKLKTIQQSNKYNSPQLNQSLEKSGLWIKELEQQAVNYKRFPTWDKTFQRQRKNGGDKAA